MATEAINPEFEYYAMQQNDALQLAMVTDGNPAGTHPLVNGALHNETNEEIFVNFDRITYQKGGALLRMMEGFLGKETFKAGLILYLNRM
jgi:aminopeptidase N